MIDEQVDCLGKCKTKYDLDNKANDYQNHSNNQHCAYLKIRNSTALKCGNYSDNRSRQCADKRDQDEDKLTSDKFVRTVAERIQQIRELQADAPGCLHMHMGNADVEQRSNQADKKHTGVSPDDTDHADIINSLFQHAGKWEFDQCGDEPDENAGTDEHTVTSKQSVSGICF